MTRASTAIGPAGPDGAPGPIATATASLVSWLIETAAAEVRTGAPASTDADGADTADTAGDPAGDPAGDQLTVWPLALRPEPELRTSGPRGPFRFQVRHLVTGATAALDRVLTAAVLAGEPAISLQPPDAQTWLALRAMPRPALLIDVPATVTRPVPTVPRVRGPLQLRGGVAPRAVNGRVLTADDVPLSGIRVAVADTHAWTYTDGSGRFAFAAVPDRDPVRLLLQGKGTRLAAELRPATEPGDTVIRFDIEEA